MTQRGESAWGTGSKLCRRGVDFDACVVITRGSWLTARPLRNLGLTLLILHILTPPCFFVGALACSHQHHPHSAREHGCELSPSTVVNNWVSYLSCWICLAEGRERASGVSQINWDQMNHLPGPTDTVASQAPQTTSLVCMFTPRVWGRWEIELKCMWTRRQDFKWWQVCVCVCAQDMCVCVCRDKSVRHV